MLISLPRKSFEKTRTMDISLDVKRYLFYRNYKKGSIIGLSYCGTGIWKLNNSYNKTRSFFRMAS